MAEGEYYQLSDAYQFLRALEHRLQMEHGLQTHSVPTDRERRELVARRMNFSGDDPLIEFDSALAMHTTNVGAAFERVFAQANLASPAVLYRQTSNRDDAFANPDEGNVRLAASIFLKHRTLLDRAKPGDGIIDLAALTSRLRNEAARSLNS